MNINLSNVARYDFAKPHVGTNDLTKDISNTVNNLKKVINVVKKNSPSTSIILSDILFTGRKT